MSIKRILISLLPILTLIALLFITIRIFGNEALNGGSQVSLLISTGVCCFISIFIFRKPWKILEGAICENIGNIGNAIIILLLIGAISGTWMLSGIVPLFIYYGVQIINPHFFLVSTCIICCLVSVMTGSSWTTVATIGIALMGIGKAQDFNVGWTAGAIISGAYFGDKISPLSDTTVLASSISGTPLFTHIKYMMYTTVPSLTISLIIFTLAGFSHEAINSNQVCIYTETLGNKFNLSYWLLIVPILTGIMIAKKKPAIIVLFLSALLAGIAALIFQTNILVEIAGEQTINAHSLFKGFLVSLYGSTKLNTGIPEINELIATKGMQGMLSTVWLILCAMCFGGSMTASGMLKNITLVLVKLTKRRVGLVGSTVISGIFFNCTASDQYLSIILTANIFKNLYQKEGYENRLLSRSIEDSSTAVSPLVPWSTCGMTQSTILNVPTWIYFPYCFFNILSPIMSVVVAITGYKVYRSTKSRF